VCLKCTLYIIRNCAHGIIWLLSTLRKKHSVANCYRSKRCPFKRSFCVFQIVSLVVTDISTESCCDVITIFDGSNFKSDLIVTLSGTSVIAPVGYNSTQRYMLIRFITDSSVASRGFKAEFRAITAVTSGLKRL
jgi:CUB domain